MRRIHESPKNPHFLIGLSSLMEHLKKIVLPISLTIGVLLSFHYWMIIDYYPSGVQIGDTLFFLVVCFSVSFIVAVILIFLLCLAQLNSDILSFLFFLITKKKSLLPKFNQHKIPIYISGVFTFCVMIISLKYMDNLRDYFLIMSVLLVSLLYMYDTLDERSLLRKYSLAGLVTIVCLFTYFNPNGVLEHFIMDTIGVRESNTTIRISEKYKEVLTSNSIIPIEEFSNGDGLYKEATILFKGVGSHVFIQIDSMKISIPSDDIIISSKIKKKK